MNPLGQRLTDALALRQSYQTVFNAESVPGRRVLRHLMRTGFILKCPFVANDPHQTAMNVGTQRLVQSILRYVYSDDDAIRKAIEQAHQEE